MKYVVRHTSTFKRDYKLMLRRHMPVERLHAIVTKLANGEPLPPANRDHPLSNNWANHRECHITPDWLLIYQIHKAISLHCRNHSISPLYKIWDFP